MEPSPSPETRVRYQFEKFCRIVIDGERSSYLRSLKRRAEHETVFSDLAPGIVETLHSKDGDPSEQQPFQILGCSISVNDDRLAESLLACGVRGYSILLLFCFFDLTDKEIGELLGVSKSKGTSE